MKILPAAGSYLDGTPEEKKEMREFFLNLCKILPPEKKIFNDAFYVYHISEKKNDEPGTQAYDGWPSGDYEIYFSWCENGKIRALYV